MKCFDCNKNIRDGYLCHDCHEYICEECGVKHFKDNPVPLVWTRAAPNRVGLWIRIKSDGQYKVHKVTREKGGLLIDWITGEFVKVKKHKKVLSYFQWFGPIKQAPATLKKENI